MSAPPRLQPGEQCLALTHIPRGGGRSKDPKIRAKIAALFSMAYGRTFAWSEAFD